MFTLDVPDELYHACRSHLAGDVEQAGFLLARFCSPRGFQVTEWRPVYPTEVAHQGRCYLELSDRMRAGVIKWAWDAALCLVEVHSHVDCPVAALSPSDLRGLADWVPHLWWRLAGRPYGALVFGEDTFDGLAWVEAPDVPEQIDSITLASGAVLPATRATLRLVSLEGARSHV